MGTNDKILGFSSSIIYHTCHAYFDNIQCSKYCANLNEYWNCCRVLGCTPGKDMFMYSITGEQTVLL